VDKNFKNLRQSACFKIPRAARPSLNALTSRECGFVQTTGQSLVLHFPKLYVTLGQQAIRPPHTSGNVRYRATRDITLR